ncbi:HAMP domain-containing histidine kinase [Aggregicoccus sp. 17bor-14]|uniref:sensor histidine kinase n=1 Tax=Myxococcaceae TaxID=31 RepID=UPI00129CBD1C|nr:MULTISPECIES: HAMP domain-containing sensor histidine kinase [Myxococcaceae]MBF5045973.1 HAMP domain-containing histidine kinase [Simulacricoccus sp. 17bor-14]MRI91705.1 HAMP domain-containing histidine kinase [Aggregicoccus sp. 17bor-14]
MKLARRIVLALVLLAVLVIAALEAVEVQRELTLARQDMQHQHWLVGRTLGASFVQAWQRDGEQEARALLAQANGAQRDLRLRWVWLEGPADLLDTPRLPPPAAPFDSSIGWNQVDERHSPPRLVTYVPVRVGGPLGRLGALELSESLVRERAHLWRTLWGTALATGCIAIVFWLASMALGRRLVGEPVERLVDMAHRIAQGDLSARVPAGESDELDALARAMNGMGESLREARERLANETAARLTTLEHLRHADRLTTVGKLASGVAHELGTPLNVVQGRARMLMSGEVQGEEAQGSARIISEQASSMTRIIRQLLDFARRRAPERVAHDAHALVGRTLELLRPLAQKRSVRLEVDCPPGLTLEVDAPQLQQVLTNLVMNGVQAMHRPGCVRVRVREQHRPLPETPDGPALDWVCLSVEDEGPGIPADVLPHIFEPFFTTKDVGEGTGLGLSVSYGLVQDHGGFIEVESAVNDGGTRFHVYLPRGGAVGNAAAREAGSGA